MTVREAAETLASDLLGGLEPPDVWATRIEAMVRAWQDEALERAALALGERLDLEGYIAHEPDTRLTRESAMEIVRSCKSGSVKGDAR